MKRLTAAVAVGLLTLGGGLTLGSLTGCATATPAVKVAPVAPESAWKRLTDEVLQVYFEENPGYATRVGDHRFDGKLDDLSREAVARKVSRYKVLDQKLSALEASSLTSHERLTREMILNTLRWEIFDAEGLQGWKRNPLNYNSAIGDGLYSLISRDFAPLEGRLRSAISRLKGVPAVVAAAKANLEHPPRIHVETAILQTPGTISLIDEDLREQVKLVPALMPEFDAVAGPAIEALKGYEKWLKEDLLPRADGDFRLGRELWQKQLGFALQSSLTPEDILARAEKELEVTRGELFTLSLPLYLKAHPQEKVGPDADEATRQKVVKSVLDSIAQERATPENLLEEARKSLAEATAFAQKADLVTLPTEPLEIIAVPAFMRGVAVAYCSSPGPLDRQLKTYYMVSPPPDSWTKPQVESFLKEYNLWTLKNLSVHEGVPGHYVQIAHANKNPDLLRAVFDSGVFVEGWATYTERMMADAGFTGDPRLQIIQRKMYVRACINAILDQKIHTQGMTEAEAMKLMTEKGFQEEREAAGKWRRACLTSTQLSTYFVGYQEWITLRQDYEKWLKDQGKPFELKAFNDKALSFGAPPPRLLRQQLMAP